MNQSKKESIIEQLVNTFSGMIIAFAVMELILAPILVIGISPLQNMWVTFWLTIVSLLRGYIIRRVFNGKLWQNWMKKV